MLLQLTPMNYAKKFFSPGVHLHPCTCTHIPHGYTYDFITYITYKWMNLFHFVHSFIFISLLTCTSDTFSNNVTENYRNLNQNIWMGQTCSLRQRLANTCTVAVRTAILELMRTNHRCYKRLPTNLSLYTRNLPPKKTLFIRVGVYHCRKKH